MPDDKSFVLPTKIPWDNLKGKELEECVYWLLHGMGARDLQWRVGGSGQGAADQGRDLEATFYSSDPDGEMSRQHWWVEAKGRTGTVEKDAVMSAAHNASVFSQVDVLVIVTNTQFSNPTIDWVKEWNVQKAKPKIRLWDRSTLERHLSERPEVVARFFSNALNTQGRLEFVRTQFWNYLQLGDGSLLKLLWQEREKLEWDAQTRIAVIASEVSNGNVGERAWGAVLSDEDLYEAFATALVNGPFLMFRAHHLGSDARGYTEALAYLLLNMLTRFKAESVVKMLEGVWNCAEGKPKFPNELQDIFITPMIGRLESELFDICQSDCHRVSTELRLLSEKQVEHYWDRLRIQTAIPTSTEDKEVFFLEATTLPCKVGFEMTKERGCPYLGNPKEELKDQLAKLQNTILFRFGQYSKREDDPLRKILR